MENGSYNPVNPKAPLKGKAAEEQNKMNSILKTAVALDWAADALEEAALALVEALEALPAAAEALEAAPEAEFAA